MTPPSPSVKSDLELKRALAGMMPDHIKPPYSDGHPFYWKDKVDWIVRDTEWLHICWLVEQELTESEYSEFEEELFNLEGLDADRKMTHISSSWQQRATALCRVKNI